MGASNLPPRARKRAPKRDGHRAQLTVPKDIWREAERVAQEVGTTPNDVVIHFAAEGMRMIERQARIDHLAERRWRAYLAAGGSGSGGEYPSREEAMRAGQALRRDMARDK